MNDRSVYSPFLQQAEMVDEFGRTRVVAKDSEEYKVMNDSLR